MYNNNNKNNNNNNNDNKFIYIELRSLEHKVRGKSNPKQYLCGHAVVNISDFQSRALFGNLLLHFV